LVDLNGKIINEYKQSLIPIENLASGVYILKLIGVDNTKMTTKFLIK